MVVHGPKTARIGAAAARATGVHAPLAAPDGLDPGSGAALVVDPRSRRLVAVVGSSVRDLEADGALEAELAVDHATGGPVTMTAIPAGYRVSRVRVTVDGDWDGGAVSVGHDGDPAAFLPAVSPLADGDVLDVSLDARFPAGGSAAILVASGATTGAATVAVRMTRIP